MTEGFWLISCIASFLVSMALTGIIIPQILLIAFRRQLFDSVDERKIHQGKVPRLGGIAFMPSIILSLAFVAGCGLMILGDNVVGFITMLQPVAICFALCGLMMLYLVGIADDLVGVKYRAKFAVQIIVALLIVVSGLWIDNLDGLFGIYEIPIWVGGPLTVLIIVFVINSINLIDGIDGLASGLSIIALLCFGYMFFELSHYLYALLAFAALGTLLPFFYFNVMGEAIKKKKIFMGDTGTLTIGFLLSFMAIEMSITSPSLVNSTTPLVLGFSPLLLPCFDVIRVFVHRIRMKQNPFLPDRCHIHHKLLAFGLNQRLVMVIILAASLFYAVISIYMSRIMNVTFVLIIDFGLWVVINYWLTRAIHRRSMSKNNNSNTLQYV